MNMATFTLTAGPDTFVGGAEDDTVNGTAATLNAGDSLSGGIGTDTLALYGSGAFRVDQLSAFTGFESTTQLTNLFPWSHGRGPVHLYVAIERAEKKAGR
jgi:hypothetical protein